MIKKIGNLMIVAPYKGNNQFKFNGFYKGVEVKNITVKGNISGLDVDSTYMVTVENAFIENGILQGDITRAKEL